MELDYKAIGKRIKIARINSDLSQEQLARLSNISTTHLSNIETGRTHVSLPTLVSLANVLETSVDHLLSDNLVHAKVEFEKDIASIIEDCNEYEIRIIKDIALAAKNSLRQEASLRERIRTS